jgi:hypothetical protein
MLRRFEVVDAPPPAAERGDWGAAGEGGCFPEAPAVAAAAAEAAEAAAEAAVAPPLAEEPPKKEKLERRITVPPGFPEALVETTGVETGVDSPPLPLSPPPLPPPIVVSSPGPAAADSAERGEEEEEEEVDDSIPSLLAPIPIEAEVLRGAGRVLGERGGNFATDVDEALPLLLMLMLVLLLLLVVVVLCSSGVKGRSRL